MRDRYIVFSDGRRVTVSNLSITEIQESLAVIADLKPMDGTDATNEDMRDRLLLELQIRGVHA